MFTPADRLHQLQTLAFALGRSEEPADLRNATAELLRVAFQICAEQGWNPTALAQEGGTQHDRPAHPDADRSLPLVSHRSSPARIAIFASSFDPPTRFHRQAAEALLACGFDEVVICPSGPRPGRDEPEHAAPTHRAALADLAFRDLPAVRTDLTDLDECRFTPPRDLEIRYAATGEVWHVVGSEMIDGGQHGRSVIQTRWDDGPQLWRRSRFVVLHPPRCPPNPADLPPVHRLIPLNGHVPSAYVRARIYDGDAVEGLLTPAIADYVRRHRLFVPFAPDRTTRLRFDRPRLMIVADERNPKAQRLAERFSHLAGDPPDLILVIGGDGMMLHTIRRHWRRRVPFLGLNAGHLGFLMNEVLPAELAGEELVGYQLPMLRVDAEAADGQAVRGVAYGDVWLERETGQAAWLRLDVDGQTRLPKVVGDGLLVATAAGSSAYARAMGAVPVPINTPVLTLAGSNVFRPRFWRPMTLADDAVVTIASLDTSGKRPVRGFIDGEALGVVRSVTVRRSAIAAIELAFTRAFDPSGKLLRSLFPPDDGG
jgi:NAD kinase/nicotinic acid mononucleotide adenylyltransferase